jgi:5'-3' exonuclease
MKTLIIDGNNLIHRTYHTANLQKKRYENADVQGLHIYFTINAIYSYVKRFLPEKTIVVWDEKIDYQQNRRKELSEDYKSNRKKDSTPHQNNEVIKTICSSLGIPSIFPRELEADDIVAYICRETPGKKVIVSVDRDFLQLVNEDTILFDPIRKKYFEIENFEENTGFKDIFDWFTAKCLTGDKSDNVSGIPGFGKVKVKKVLSGELKLTTEQEEKYFSNRDLFRLDLYEDFTNEKTYYKNQLDKTEPGDYKLFLKLVEKYNMVSIMKRKDHWYETFFLNTFLHSIND